jgi:hypothetical protein
MGMLTSVKGDTNAHKFFVVKPKGKTPLRKLGCKRNGIKVDPRQIG